MEMPDIYNGVAIINSNKANVDLKLTNVTDIIGESPNGLLKISKHKI